MSPRWSNSHLSNQTPTGVARQRKKNWEKRFGSSVKPQPLEIPTQDDGAEEAVRKGRMELRKLEVQRAFERAHKRM